MKTIESSLYPNIEFAKVKLVRIILPKIRNKIVFLGESRMNFCWWHKFEDFSRVYLIVRGSQIPCLRVAGVSLVWVLTAMAASIHNFEEKVISSSVGIF